MLSQDRINQNPEKPENEAIDLTQYWRILKRRKFSVILICMFFVSLSVLYLSKATPMYSAAAKIQADPIQPNASSRDQFVMNSMVFLFYETQYEIIRSRNIAETVVDKLALVERFKNEQKETGQKEKTDSWAKKGISKLRATLLGGEIDNTASETISDNQIRMTLAYGIQSRLEVEGGTQSQIIHFRYESDDPNLAADIVNAIADAYIEFGLESRLSQIKDTSEWLSEQLADLRITLQNSEERLREFRLNSNLMGTEQQARLSNAQLQNLNTELIRAQTELSEAEELYTQVNQIRTGGGDFRSLRPVINSSTVRDLVREESTLARRVQELSERYGEKHPSMIAARSDLSSAKENLSSEVVKIVNGIESEYQLAKVQVNNIKQLILNTTETLQSFQGDTFELTRLEREVENNRRVYESFLSRLTESDVSSNYDASNIRIIDRATVPEFPVKPKPFQIISVGIFFGLAMGVLFVFILESLGNVFRTPDQIEEILGLPTLGITPLVKNKTTSPEKQYLTDQRSTFAEAINTIRTAIIFSNVDKPPKTILITSTSGSEGKTTLAINLAVAFSQMNKTLLIELDLRKPAIGKDLAIDSKIGLSDLLSGSTDANVFHQIEDSPNLRVITCGTIPPNPTELISSERFKNLLDSLTERYEYIILDSPPTLPVSDSSILSQIADVTLIAVKAEDTKINMVKETTKRLHKINANIGGFVLTQASPQKMSYYGEHYYQNSYYGEEKQ